MRLRTRTALVGAATLLTVGGVAYAFVPTTSVTGSGQVQTTSDAARLELTVDKVGVDVIGQGTAYLDVIAYNPTVANVLLPEGRLAKPTLQVFKKVGVPGVCSQSSFTVGTPTNYTLVLVAPDDTAVVAQVPVTFNDLPENQNACIGATLRLTWPLQGI